MNPDPKSYTCTILHGRKRIGSGFLVHREKRLVVTCHHVLAAVMPGSFCGRLFNVRFLQEGVDESVLPALALEAADRKHDIALLQLQGEVPVGVSAAPLIDSADVSGLEFRLTAYGEMEKGSEPPHDYLAAHGTVGGESKRDGVRLLQLDSKNILPGMSGAPVTVAALGGVVGLVASRYNIDPKTTTWMRDVAWCVRIEALKQFNFDIEFQSPRPIQAALPITNVVEQRVLNITSTESASCDGSFGENRIHVKQVYSPDSWKRPVAQDPRKRWETLIGRTAELDEIDKRLRPGPSAKRSRKAAVFGFSGIGKSTVAAAYAHDYGNVEDFPGGVLWASVGNSAPEDLGRIINHWATLAYGKDRVDLLSVGGKEVQFDAEAARHLLSGHGPLLAILDDVGNWDKITPLLEALPLDDTCVLLTTPNRQIATKFADPSPPIELHGLEPDCALNLLHQYDLEVDSNLVAQLVEAIGGHPQTLRLIASQICERSTCERRRKTVLDLIDRLEAGDRLSVEDSTQVALGFAYDEIGKAPDERREFQHRLQQMSILAPFESDFSAELVACLWETTTEEAADFLEQVLRQRAWVMLSNSERWFQPALMRTFLSQRLQPDAAEFAFPRYREYVLDRSELLENLPDSFGELALDLPHILYVGSALIASINEFCGLNVEDISVQGVMTYQVPEAIPDHQREWLNAAQVLAVRISNYAAFYAEAQPGAERWFAMGVLAARLLNETDNQLRLLITWYQWCMQTDRPDDALEVLHEFEGVAQKFDYGVECRLFLQSEMGVVRQRLGDSEKAEKAYESADALVSQDTSSDIASSLKANFYLNCADFYLARAEYRRAAEYLERAEALPSDQVDPLLRLRLAQSMAVAYVECGDYPAALLALQAAKPLLDLPASFSSKALILNNTGYILGRLGELQDARAVLNDALALAEQQSFSVQLMTLTNLAHILLCLDQPEPAFRYIQRAEHLLNRVNNKMLEGRTHASLGLIMIAYSYGDPAQALSHLERSLSLLLEARETTIATETVAAIANIYRMTRQAQKGLNFFRQFLPVAQKLDNRSSEAAILSAMGLLCYETEDVHSARQYIEQADRLLVRITDAAHRASVLSMLAESCLLLGELSKCASQLEDALCSWRETGNQVKVGETLLSLTYVCLGLREIPKARGYLDQVRPMIEQSNSKVNKAGLHNTKGLLCMEAGGDTDLGEAITEFGLAQELGREIQNPELVVAAGNNIANAYLRLDKTDQALGAIDDVWQLVQKLDQPDLQATVLGNLGLVYVFRKNLPKGRAKIEAAIDLLNSHGLNCDRAGQTIELWRFFLDWLLLSSQGEALPDALPLHKGLQMLIRSTSLRMAEQIASFCNFQQPDVDGWFRQQIAATSDDATLQNVLRLYRDLFTKTTQLQLPLSEVIAAAGDQFEKGFMYHWWGRLHLAAGSYGWALAALNRALEIEPKSVCCYADRGWVYRGLGDYNKSINDFEQAISLDRDSEAGYLGLGVARFESGSLAPALHDLTQAIKLQSTNSFAYQWRGTIYLRLGDTTAALQDLDQAISLDGNWSDHYYWRALTYLRKGYYRDALTDLDSVFKLDAPDSSQRIYAVLWRGVVKQLEKQDSYALADLRSAACQATNLLDSVQKHFLLALHGVVSEKLDSAYDEYQKVLDDLHVIRHIWTTQLGHLRLLARLFPERKKLSELSKWLEQEVNSRLGIDFADLAAA